ncbi:MAG TPA: substrate-binding domain-containing protein [Pseudolabrys sp.]|jgi:molybdate transport system substrate-binding protein
MPTLKVLSAGAVKSMVEALGPEFGRASGNKLDVTFGTAFAQRERVIGGAAADVVILSESIVAELEKLGLTLAGSARNLGRTVTGVIVPEGAAMPDISTVEAFKQALLDAKSVAYTDPKAGGSGGIMFAGLLQTLGIADAVNAKAVLCKGGLDVSTKIAEKRAEIGTTFISEALPVKGLKVVGPLPGELHNANTYTAAIHKAANERAGAAAFIAALTDPATRPRWTAAGLEPAF